VDIESDEDRPRKGFPPAIFPASCTLYEQRPSYTNSQIQQEPQQQRLGTDPDGTEPKRTLYQEQLLPISAEDTIHDLNDTSDGSDVDGITVVHSNQSSVHDIPYWQAPSNESFDTRDGLQWDSTSYTGAAIGGIPIIPYMEDMLADEDAEVRNDVRIDMDKYAHVAEKLNEMAMATPNLVMKHALHKSHHQLRKAISMTTIGECEKNTLNEQQNDISQRFVEHLQEKQNQRRSKQHRVQLDNGANMTIAPKAWMLHRYRSIPPKLVQCANSGAAVAVGVGYLLIHDHGGDLHYELTYHCPEAPHMIFLPNATTIAAQHALGIEMEWSIVKNAKGHAACTLRHPQGMYTYTAYTQNGLQFLTNEVIMPVYAPTTNEGERHITMSINAAQALNPTDPQRAPNNECVVNQDDTHPQPPSDRDLQASIAILNKYNTIHLTSKINNESIKTRSQQICNEQGQAECDYVTPSSATVSALNADGTFELWHQRLNHSSPEVMYETQK
jgi:hypothetical protein